MYLPLLLVASNPQSQSPVALPNPSHTIIKPRSLVPIPTLIIFAHGCHCYYFYYVLVLLLLLLFSEFAFSSAPPLPQPAPVPASPVLPVPGGCGREFCYPDVRSAVVRSPPAPVMRDVGARWPLHCDVTLPKTATACLLCTADQIVHLLRCLANHRLDLDPSFQLLTDTSEEANQSPAWPNTASGPGALSTTPH